jgi:uncharacterized protein
MLENSKKKRNILISFAALIIVGFLCLAYSYFIEPQRLVVNQQIVKVKNWDKTFDGLKIALISDLHAGSNGVTEEKIRRIVEMANAQNPDLTVLLGDYVSQQSGDRRQLKMTVEKIAENLRGLRAKYGVFAVLGNHDGEYGDRKIYDAFTEIGIRVLEQEIEYIEKDGKKLKIVGLEDHLKIQTWRNFQIKVRDLVKSGEQTESVLVLEHAPDVLPLFVTEPYLKENIDLLLVGHSHGGQVWLPIIGSPVVPSNYGQKYAYGHIREEDMDMFVTTGIGESILPLRFLVPPEIAVIEVFAE